MEEFDDIRLPAIPWEPSYNVAPQSIQPVVRTGPDGISEVVPLRWGLVPFWSKDPKASYSTFNARCETVATAPAFREALRHRRCLVPADAFYEWKQLDPKINSLTRSRVPIRDPSVLPDFGNLGGRRKDAGRHFPSSQLHPMN